MYFAPGLVGVPVLSLVIVIVCPLTERVCPPSKSDQELKVAEDTSNPEGKVILSFPSAGVVVAVVNLIMCLVVVETVETQAVWETLVWQELVQIEK